VRLKYLWVYIKIAYLKFEAPIAVIVSTTIVHELLVFTGKCVEIILCAFEKENFGRLILTCSQSSFIIFFPLYRDLRICIF
jgi:hypothetical protein